MGMSSLMSNVLKCLYSGTSASVWCEKGLTEELDTTVGLRQGCVLSPLLFSLFVNDLPGALGHDYNFGGRRVNVLLYADDIVILAPSAPGLTTYDQRFCNTWNLFNLNKSTLRKGF